MNTQLFKGYGLLGMAGLCLLLAVGANVAQAAKTAVCHLPPGNPGNIQLINVGGSAVNAHLNHGDYLVTPEVCDAIDNDCDRVVDDNPTDLTVCSAGVGECVAMAQEVCVAGGIICPASPGTPPEVTETSCNDGLDNDCDGNTDGADSDCAVACPCTDIYDSAILTYMLNGGDLNDWDSCAFDDDAGNTTSLDSTPGTFSGNLDLTLFKQYQGAQCGALVESDAGGQLYSDSVTGLSGPQEAACAALQLSLCGND